MAKKQKRTQYNQIINLAAKMNNRANDEVLNLDANQQGIDFDYFENGDLYYSKALTNRKGTSDLCCGIVGQSFSDVPFIQTASGVNIGGVTLSWIQTNDFLNATDAEDHPTTVFIPQADAVLTSGTVIIRDTATVNQYTARVTNGETTTSFGMQAQLFKLDQTPSGVGIMTGPSGTVNNINYTGFNWASNPYPQYASGNSWNTGLNVPYTATPEAVANGVVTNSLSDFSLNPSTGRYESAGVNANLAFDAPVFVSSGVAYAIRYTQQRLVDTEVGHDPQVRILTLGSELDANSMYVKEVNDTAVRSYTLASPASLKTWVANDWYQYGTTPDFLNPDYKTADTNLTCPVENGESIVGTKTVYTQDATSTTTADFGQVLQLASGVNTYYGTYFWAGLGGNSSLTMPYSSDTNIGVKTSIYSIDTVSGTLVGGDYEITGKTLLATGSGNYVFDPELNSDIAVGTVRETSNYRLNKIYTVFDNPVSISGDGAGNDHLVTFGFYDYATGDDLTDIAPTPASTYTAYSPMVVGTENGTPNYSGNYVIDYAGNGTFAHPSGVYSTYPFNNIDFDLTCGLIRVNNGNAIQGIYDYRIGDSRTSQIVYGQAGNLNYFDLDTPCQNTHTQIYSGTVTDNDALWCFDTYDDLMFAHQYAQTNGQCWDQVYSTTMDHGQRPSGNIVGISGTGGTMPSGVPYKVRLVNEYSSGGYRSSDAYEITISGTATATSNMIQVSGLANQFKFDTPADNMYIFVTQASGSVYYLADIYDQPDLTAGSVINYPIPSGTDVAYIWQEPATQDNTISSLFTYPQNYIVSQTDTPKFKKMSLFYDYVVGIGDPTFPSRFYYSEQYAPQIWGESFDFHGFIEVDKDNGSPLTAMAPLRDYMILFKKNACYRMEFLGNNAQPFSISPISSRVGSLGSFSTVSVGDTVYGLSQYGVFACNGATVEIISDPIDPWWRELDPQDLAFAVAIHDQHEDKIIWSISNNKNNDDNNYGLIYNYIENSFCVRKGGMWNAAGVVGDDDEFDVLLAGTVNGQIKKLEVTNADSDNLFNDGNGAGSDKAIQLIGETPWMSVGGSQVQKQLKHLDINCEQADAQLAVDVYFDENETDRRYTRYIDLNSKSPDKRTHLGGQAKTVKFRIYNVGNPALIKIKGLTLYYAMLSFHDAM